MKGYSDIVLVFLRSFRTQRVTFFSETKYYITCHVDYLFFCKRFGTPTGIYDITQQKMLLKLGPLTPVTKLFRCLLFSSSQHITVLGLYICLWCASCWLTQVIHCVLSYVSVESCFCCNLISLASYIGPPQRTYSLIRKKSLHLAYDNKFNMMYSLPWGMLERFCHANLAKFTLKFSDLCVRARAHNHFEVFWSLCVCVCVHMRMHACIHTHAQKHTLLTSIT